MTGQTKTQAPPERHSDFWQRLEAEGVDMRHIRETTYRIQGERNEAIATAARLYFGTEGKPMSLFEIGDRLEELARRAWGVRCAIDGVLDDRSDCYSNGLQQVAEDLAHEIERVSEAFSAESPS